MPDKVKIIKDLTCLRLYFTSGSKLDEWGGKADFIKVDYADKKPNFL